MKRLGFSVVVCFLFTAPLAAGDPGLKKTADFVQSLQASSGGFMLAPRKPDLAPIIDLRTTSAAVRTLHYLGAEIPNKPACVKYVDACYDPKTGGFSELPAGKPDVFSTAVGLMAISELKMPRDKYAAGAMKYLSENVKSFEDIRIAVAGLEAIQQKSPQTGAWIQDVKRLQNQDGTFGEGPGQARATGGSVAALLRLGAKPAQTDAILKVLKAGQRRNGGYGKGDSDLAADLETTYRVMRCFVMLKARPDNVEGIRSFVAKCRNEDGGYGVAPGQPSTVNGTYYAAVILQWLKQ